MSQKEGSAVTTTSQDWNWRLDRLKERVARLQRGIAQAEAERDESAAHELRRELQHTMDAINFETIP